MKQKNHYDNGRIKNTHQKIWYKGAVDVGPFAKMLFSHGNFETDYWLVMIEEMGLLSGDQLKEQTREANELLSIIVKSLVRAKTNQRLHARKK
jgi:hypothetical protein